MKTDSTGKRIPVGSKQVKKIADNRQRTGTSDAGKKADYRISAGIMFVSKEIPGYKGDADSSNGVYGAE